MHQLQKTMQGDALTEGGESSQLAWREVWAELRREQAFGGLGLYREFPLWSGMRRGDKSLKRV